jgi:hypothetical protein
MSWAQLLKCHARNDIKGVEEQLQYSYCLALYGGVLLAACTYEMCQQDLTKLIHYVLIHSHTSNTFQNIVVGMVKSTCQ